MARSSRSLQPTRTGGRHEPVDVLNRLAAWLEPRWMSIATAEMVEAMFAAAVEGLSVEEQAGLSPSARRWLRASTSRAEQG